MGTEFQVVFGTALSASRKAEVGQALINALIAYNWTIPVLSTPYDVVALPVADFGNGTDGELLFRFSVIMLVGKFEQKIS